ncbi:hypothetical protein ACYULU_12220 [Breznakiellaceae bacterium SP9]
MQQFLGTVTVPVLTLSLNRDTEEINHKVHKEHEEERASSLSALVNGNVQQALPLAAQRKRLTQSFAELYAEFR